MSDNEYLLVIPGTVVRNPTGGTELFRVVGFNYLSPSPLILPDAMVIGQAIVRCGIKIETRFDDPSATILLGTPALPSRLMGASDSRPSMADQYENDILDVFAVNAPLQLTINPGASTQGSGYVFYQIEG